MPPFRDYSPPIAIDTVHYITQSINRWSLGYLWKRPNASPPAHHPVFARAIMAVAGLALLLMRLLLLVALVRATGVERECRREGMIAFTFDQGPSQYTGILLTSLAKAGVKATFHVLPDYLDNPVLSANLRRAATDGHLIGLFVKESITEASLKSYLSNASTIIKQYTNHQPQFLRFPLPGPSPSVLKLVAGLGYRVTGYNLDSQDYQALNDVTSPDGKGTVFATIKGILDQIVPPTLGSFICVQRDIVQASVQQMPAILNYTKARGYRAVRLDECIGAGVSVDADDQGGKGHDMGGDMKGQAVTRSHAPSQPVHNLLNILPYLCLVAATGVLL